MTRADVGRISLAALALGAASIVAAGASDDFNERFSGRWAGSGIVQRSSDAAPRRVTCTLAGESDERLIGISGRCRAAIIFTRAIGASLSFDPRTGLYAGTYTGSQAGTARLAGRRSGDAITLTVTFPRPVGGDRTATMIIRSQGGDRFDLTVMDRLHPGGPVTRTTDLTFVRR